MISVTSRAVHFKGKTAAGASGLSNGLGIAMGLFILVWVSLMKSHLLWVPSEMITARDKGADSAVIVLEIMFGITQL